MALSTSPYLSLLLVSLEADYSLLWTGCFPEISKPSSFLLLALSNSCTYYFRFEFEFFTEAMLDYVCWGSVVGTTVIIDKFFSALDELGLCPSSSLLCSSVTWTCLGYWRASDMAEVYSRLSVGKVFLCYEDVKASSWIWFSRMLASSGSPFCMEFSCASLFDRLFSSPLFAPFELLELF